MSFLDVKTDFAFRKVFGSYHSKEILISFLNSVLEFKGDHVIEDLVVTDPYQIPLLKGMKDSYVDVKAVLSDQTQIIIEMQVLNTDGFEKRVLYNAAKLYSTQIKKGDKFSSLKPIIALTFTNFTMFDDGDQLVSRFKLMEKDRLIQYNDDIELVFVELPKFTKMEGELKSMADKWIYFIKHAGQMENIPGILRETDALRDAFELANYANLSAKEGEIQSQKLDFIQMQNGSIALALKQGKSDERIRIAGNMHRSGIAPDAIATLTGFSIAEVLELTSVQKIEKRL